MLTCIACSKHHLSTNGSIRDPPEEEEDAATTSTKQAVKALTSQVKDMAVKGCGAYKNCRPCLGSSGRHNGQACVDSSDVGSVSERFFGSYRRAKSASSTPGLRGKALEAKLKALSSGSTTPASVSGRTESVLFVEEDEPKEWVAQVEPGVLITFVSLPQSGNDLKRIQFSREIFNKWQAQRWWADNYDKVMELYNVQRFNRDEVPMPTPSRSEDEVSKLESTEDSPMTPPLSKEHPPRHIHHATTGVGYSSSDSVEHQLPLQSHHRYSPGGLNSTPKLSSVSAAKTETSSVDASARSSLVDHSGELSVSSASDLESEWVEQDEPGVYITIRALPGGGRELRRVRFSRERFEENQARLWWEENRARIKQQYL